MSDTRDGSREPDPNWKDNRPLPNTKPTSVMYAVGTGSDPGKRKSRNEDSIFAVISTCNTYTPPLPYGLFVVADGIGAYANGQDAGRCAIQAMVDFILPKIVRSDILQQEACSMLLTEAVQLANEAVNQYNIHLRNRGADVDAGVITTITVAMVVGLTAYIANVGNSRTYLYRRGEGLKKITKDHSIVALMAEAGSIKPDDVDTHPKRNFIYRCLGSETPAEIDIFIVQLRLGDKLLLCSYGLWDMVPDLKIENVISHAPLDLSKVVETLIQAALDNGGKHDVSAIVVSMLETEGPILIPGIQLFAKPDSVQIPPM